MNYKLEVIGFTIESCIAAQQAGAHRIELCDNPAEGGTTPSYGFIKAAREKLQIDLYTMIRPRGGDFLYSDDEFEMMCEDVKVCKSLMCDGVVFGILNADGTVDRKRNAKLLELAYPMGVTFHRAFDRTNNAFEALETLIDLGFERVLTSGQRPTVTEGKELLKALVEKADERIIVMPGSGIRSNNIKEIAAITGASEFHSSARKQIESKMNYLNTEMNEQLTSVIADGEEIKRLLAELNSLPQFIRKSS
ncbi:MAG: copper homeostasis protein CutC [Sphingobacteriales bacterium]|nr:copper homeostasis protein CutC [Sphingobacteriales bacterium]